MSKKQYHKLEALFYPKTLAVVGATSKGGAFSAGGNGFIEGAFSMNFPGKIYPVNPKAESILGFTAYKSVRDIPGEVDLVIFAVPHTAAISVMKDCVAKKVKFVHLFTAGFSETGLARNAHLEKELLTLAKEGGVRIVGPNCMGLYCPEGGLAWSKDFPKESGDVGFVSQSGQLASMFVDSGGKEKLRFSKVISFGNASDIKCNEFMNYLANDDKTRIIGSYLEGLKDGEAFFEEAKKLTLKKPLVVWKGGQTKGGSRATRSHTGSIAGSMQIWQAVCKQVGIISVNSLDELISTLAALKRIPLPGGVRAAILGGAGGGSVTMTDEAERAGLEVPRLSEATLSSLVKFIPPQGSSIENPLDILMGLVRPGAPGEDNFLKVFRLLREDPNIDALIFSQEIALYVRIGGRFLVDFIIKKTCEGIKEIKKPVFVVVARSRTVEEECLRQEVIYRYHDDGIPSFSSFSDAARILFNMNEYRKYLECEKSGEINFP
jgi:acyl-CoA synthetase (NDP forming)